jgi:hypothetical protein
MKGKNKLLFHVVLEGLFRYLLSTGNCESNLALLKTDFLFK